MEKIFTAEVLSLLREPAFAVEDGRLTLLNDAARALGLREGDLLAEVVDPVPQTDVLPPTFEAVVCGELRELRTRQEGETALFALSAVPRFGIAMLSRTSAALRESLQRLRTGLDTMTDALDLEQPASRESHAAAVRGFFQLTRTADQLDCWQQLLSGCSADRRKVQLGAALREQLDLAEGMLRMAGQRLDWSVSPTHFNGWTDLSVLRLILWSLLSDAARRGGEELTVRAVRKRLQTLELTVACRQTQKPAGGETDLALPLAEACARLLGGSLLLSEGADGSRTALLSVDLREPKTPRIGTPMYVPTHGVTDGLFALSEALPLAAFDPRDLF